MSAADALVLPIGRLKEEKEHKLAGSVLRGEKKLPGKDGISKNLILIFVNQFLLSIS